MPTVEELINLDLSENRTDLANVRLEPYIAKFTNSPTPLFLKAKILVVERKTNEAIATLDKSIGIDPNFQVGHRALIELYLASGKRDTALAKLESMLKKNPKDLGSLLQMAMLQEAMRDYKAARASYEALLKARPDHAISLNNLANILSEHFSETDAAYELARQARELAPENPAIGDTFGWQLWKKGEYTRALTVLQEAAEKLPQPEVKFHLGMAFYSTGAEAAARVNLEEAVKSNVDFPGKDVARGALATLTVNPASADAQTIELIQKAVAKNPSDFVAQMRLAQIYEQQKAAEKAAEAYRAALKINPRSTEALARLAEVTATDLRNPQAGLEYAKQAWAIAKTPAFASSFGRIGYHAGDFKWAAITLSDARRAQPNDPNISFYLGLAQFGLANISQAKDLFEAASAPASRNLLAQHATAFLAFQIDPIKDPIAQPRIAAALQIDQNFPPALVAAGLLAENSNDLKAARSSYEQVLKTFPQHRAAQRQLGLLLAEKLADDPQAASLLSAVKTDLPGDSLITKSLGKIAYRRNDYNEASQLLRDALIKYPNDADILYHLGMAQYHLNDRQATNYLGRALTLDANGSLAADAKKAMERLK